MLLLVSTSLLGALGLALVGGWVPLERGLPGGGSSELGPGGTMPGHVGPRAGARLLLALGTGLVVLVASGWPVPAFIGATCAFLASRTAFAGRRAEESRVVRLEALASWIESLRDVLIAGEQPVGAVLATVRSCPPVIRAEVGRLADGLAGSDPGVAIREFADELDDPIADLVASGLWIAVTRGARSVTVLGALASQTRQLVERRRLVEAERAPARREVDILTGLMTFMLAALLLLGRSEFLVAYRTLEGQAVLGLSVMIFAALVARTRALARFPSPGRFLRTRDGQQVGVPSIGATT